MKQVVQNLGNGVTSLIDVPAPKCLDKHVLVSSRASLISLGTEKMLVEFGKATLLEKARKQPDKVKMVIDKARTDGIQTTYEAVRSKLNQPIAMGYCCAGVVVEEIGTEFKQGDRVLTNGAHAEVVCVPHNLVAKIPSSVSFETASFTPVAAIGLQGIRLANPQLGETVVVMGLGLIGLLTIQMLVAQGCQVIGLDFDREKVSLAESFGAKTILLDGTTSPVAAVEKLTAGIGADAVLIAASTSSSDPVTHAAQMSRKRGKIVLIGVTGLNLSRADFYEKELSFQVSCSYGPGRYDANYEKLGQDYPVGFVRWTEKRNFEAVLKMMEVGSINVGDLVTSQHAVSEAETIYQNLSSNKNALGVILEYDAEKPNDELLVRKVHLSESTRQAVAPTSKQTVCAGVLGAGNYASRVLIPAMKKAGISLSTVVSSGGLSAAHHGKANGFDFASSDKANLLENSDINLVVIATQHNSHASLVCDALQANKHVFVEKPLALSYGELEAIESTWNSLGTDSSQQLMVGFNRRFAPHVITAKSLLDTVKEPKTFNFMMNAGDIPKESWVQSAELGGGRIIGEACHLIDLMRFLADHPIVSVHARSISKPDASSVMSDKAIIMLEFADGSLGSIHYFANGDKGFPKERYEVFAAGKVLQIDNFRKLTGFGWPNFKKNSLLKQDKGQEACIAQFARNIASGVASPIPMDQLLEVSRVAIEADEQIRSCQ